MRITSRTKGLGLLGISQPQCLRQRVAHTASLAAGAGAPDSRQPGLVGIPTPRRPRPTPDQRLARQCPPPRQPRVGPQVPHHGHRDPERRWHDQSWSASRALADAGMSSLLDQIQYKASWYGTRDRGGRPVVSQQQDLLRLRCGERGSRPVHGNGSVPLRRQPRPQPECSSQSAETCATRGRRGCNAPGRGSAGTVASTLGVGIWVEVGKGVDVGFSANAATVAGRSGVAVTWIETRVGAGAGVGSWQASVKTKVTNTTSPRNLTINYHLS